MMNNELNISPILMSNSKLVIKEVIQEAWTNVDGFKGKCLLGFVIYMIVAVITLVLSHALSPGGLNSLTVWPPEQHPQLSFSAVVVQIIGKVIYYLLFYGVLFMAIRRTNNLPVLSSMQFSTFKYPRYLQIIGLYLLKVLILFISFLPLVIPSLIGMVFPHTNLVKLTIGIIFLLCVLLILVVAIYYVTLRLSMATMIILDKGFNPIEAIKLSYNATKGNSFKIFVIGLFQILVLVISIIPLGIGLIWSIPFCYLLYPAIYRRLIGVSMKQ